MRVIVTGSEGYVGRVLCAQLLNEGHEVIGIDACFFESCDYEGSGKIPHDYELIRKDIRDLEESDFAGADAVIHLAGLSNDPLGDFDPELTHSINGLAIHGDIGRFIFASSASVYGRLEGWADEDSPSNPQTPYAESKANAESHLGNGTALRAATVYGLSPMIRFDLVANNLCAWASATGKIHLKSTGNAWRPLLHVSDLARAYRTVLSAPQEIVSGRIYNVGSSDENFTVREIAETIAKQRPHFEIEFADDAEPDTRSYRMRCDRIKEELDFRPEWTLERGIEELLTAFESHPVRVADFEGPRYQRLAHLKRLISDGKLTAKLRPR